MPATLIRRGPQKIPPVHGLENGSRSLRGPADSKAMTFCRKERRAGPQRRQFVMGRGRPSSQGLMPTLWGPPPVGTFATTRRCPRSMTERVLT